MQADFADMQDLADENDRARFMLTVVDLFSKFAWAVTIRTKNSSTVTSGFAKLLRMAKLRCQYRLRTNRGTEFFNAPFGRMLKCHRLAHLAS